MTPYDKNTVLMAAGWRNQVLLLTSQSDWSNATMKLFDPVHNQWSSLPDVPAVAGFLIDQGKALCVIADHIYVQGGYHFDAAGNGQDGVLRVLDALKTMWIYQRN